ncbi:MAG: FAD-binding protein [Halobacteriaceae archaeon]
MDRADVLVVGGGVAGLTAAVFTARADLDTLVASADDPILARNAHLENVPGFPAGVNPRQYLDLLREQAESAGATRVRATVERLASEDGPEGTGFVATLADGDAVRADRVIAASWSDAGYLDGLPVATDQRGSKTFLQPERGGRTAVAGLYAAGRLADRFHQTVVAAGSGAEAALALIHDSDVPFYHDWVVPEGYFTDRGRGVPPGCEEVDADERERRAAESRRVMRERFAEPHPDDPTPHPSLED